MTPTQMLLPTSRAGFLLKRMDTTMGIFVWSPILVSHGSILVIEPVRRLFVTRIIQPMPRTLLPYLPNFRLLNFMYIDNEPRDIHVITKHCSTTLFSTKLHSHHKFVHPSPRVGHHAWRIHIEFGEFERVLLHIHLTLKNVHEFNHILLPQP